MSDRYARYGAASGILFVVFVVIGFLVQPKPPAVDAPAAEILQYLTDHDSALHVVQVIFAFAAFFYLWFVGTLRAVLARSEAPETRLADIAFGGALVSAAALLAGGGLQAAATLHASESSPEVTRALVDASLLVPAVAAPAVVVFFAANALSILRSGYLPSWLGWLAIAAAVFNALGVGAVFTDHGAFAADGVLGFFIGFALFLIWFLAASVTLMGRLAGERQPAVD
jgi:hypothetical protein